MATLRALGAGWRHDPQRNDEIKTGWHGPAVLAVVKAAIAEAAKADVADLPALPSMLAPAASTAPSA